LNGYDPSNDPRGAYEAEPTVPGCMIMMMVAGIPLYLAFLTVMVTLLVPPSPLLCLAIGALAAGVGRWLYMRYSHEMAVTMTINYRRNPRLGRWTPMPHELDASPSYQAVMKWPRRIVATVLLAICGLVALVATLGTLGAWWSGEKNRAINLMGMLAGMSLVGTYGAARMTKNSFSTKVC